MMRSSLSLLIIAVLPFAAGAQPNRRDAVVIYKDGYVVKGKIHEDNKTIFDSETGAAINVGTGDFFLDDGIRSIMFSPGQVSKVTRLKDDEVPNPRMYVRQTIPDRS